jgi:hypothetical protein
MMYTEEEFNRINSSEFSYRRYCKFYTELTNLTRKLKIEDIKKIINKNEF